MKTERSVVLLAINAKYIHSALSVWLISAGIKAFAKHSYDVCVLEATINQNASEIASMVLQHNPQVVGISAYIWNARILPSVISLLKESSPDIVIVLGGHEAIHNKDYWLEEGADYVLDGEGEYTFPAFLDTLYEKGEFAGDRAGQPDCAFDLLSEVNVASKPQCNAASVNPYTAEYLSTLSTKISYIETSRGCPFSCSFCLSANEPVKYFPLDTVKKQLFALASSGTKIIKFVDRTFNSDCARAYEILDYIINSDFGCTFHFEAAPDLFDEATMTLLKSAPAGKIQFELGIQSFHKPALEYCSCVIDLDKAAYTTERLVDMGNIHVHIGLIAGLPYETLPDFVDTFNRAFALKAHNLQLGFLKLLRGSRLRANARDLEITFSATPPYEIISSPWLSQDDLATLKLAEHALNLTYNKSRFITALDYTLDVTGIDAFSLFLKLGSYSPGRGKQLEDYIKDVFCFCKNFDGVDENTLKDKLIYDWLGMVKGKNLPEFLITAHKDREPVFSAAQQKLGRAPRKEEYALLRSGHGIFVDSNARNPVTGLYEVCEVDKIQKLTKHVSYDLRPHTAAIATLAGVIWKEHYTPIIGAAQVDYMLRKYQSAEQIYADINEHDFTYFTAADKENDILIGYCAVKPQDDYLLLSKLYVHSDYRGRGIARRFLGEVAILCRHEYGFEKIRLTVNKNNIGAITAYEKMGFETIDSVKVDIGSGFFMDDYVMETNLH